MITVSFFEVIFFMIIILIFSGLNGLNNFLGSLDADFYIGFNTTALVLFIIGLFSDSVRDTIDYIFEKRSWKCYLVNVIAVGIGGYMYFRFLCSLPGTAKLTGTLFMIIYYAIYFLAIGIFYILEDLTSVKTASHTNILTGILLGIIAIFFAIINMWNIGYTVTKNTIASDQNISYYVVKNDVNIYNSIDGRTTLFGSYKVTSSYEKSYKNMTVYPALIEERYIHKGGLTFVAVYYGSSNKLGFVNLYNLTPYYNDMTTTPELINIRDTVIQDYYPGTPKFIIYLCLKLYHNAPLGSLHIAN